MDNTQKRTTTAGYIFNLARHTLFDEVPRASSLSTHTRTCAHVQHTTIARLIQPTDTHPENVRQHKQTANLSAVVSSDYIVNFGFFFPVNLAFSSFSEPIRVS